MGWGDCGTDSKGRPIGYNYVGTCDHPECNEEVNRGLGCVCGGMHGEDEYSCEGYFCGEHLWCFSYEDTTEEFEDPNLDEHFKKYWSDMDTLTLCPECYAWNMRFVEEEVVKYYEENGTPNDETFKAYIELRTKCILNGSIEDE
jgi:hypothetical protein